jgi:hypothetical protein
MTDQSTDGLQAGSGVTLQINLSAGDAGYAAITVPALLASHDPTYRRLLVVDGCRPQRTRIFDPDVRVPEPGFSERLERRTGSARGWFMRWLSSSRATAALLPLPAAMRDPG